MGLALVDNWILMALLATAAWALASVLDVCLIGNGVYRRPLDGPLVAGLFCLLPALLAVGALQVEFVTLRLVTVSALSAGAFLLHVYCHFKALFSQNDGVNAEIFNTLGMVVVPILAFVLLRERLAATSYISFVVAAAGIWLLIKGQARRMPARAVGFLIASVSCFSLMMVMQAWALRWAPYATVVFLFTTSVFLLAGLLLVVRHQHQARVLRLCRRFGPAFVGLQLLEIGAVVSSQRAIATGPSVSLVALVECTLPLFVLAICWVLGVTTRRTTGADGSSLQSTLALQIEVAPSKVLSLLVIAGGVSIALLPT